MRKIIHLTAIALLGISASAYAQDAPKKQKYILAKGTKMFTGRLNAGFSSGGPTYRSGGFGIGEQNGFFVANNFSIGTVVHYGFSYTRDLFVAPPPGFTQYPRVQMMHSPSVGLAMRYYKMFTPRFGFFAEFVPLASFNINTVRIEDGSPNTDISYTYALDVSVTPNLVFFVTDKFALEAGFGRLGYSHTFGGPVHTANLGVSPNLNLGMSFYLGKGVQPKN